MRGRGEYSTQYDCFMKEPRPVEKQLSEGSGHPDKAAVIVLLLDVLLSFTDVYFQEC